MRSDIMVIIDPGHGGFDPGGGSNTSFKEKDKALQISEYQYNRFKELGIPVKLTRSTDETLNPSSRLNRIESLGASNSDILISNHINTGGDEGGEVIYALRSSKALPQLIANNLNQAGLPIRNVYQRVGKQGRDYYFILRGTSPNNAMIIEYGFADNDKDTYRLLYDWVNLAESVVKSITEYLGYKYTNPQNPLYVVKPGDTLYLIAKNNNTTVTKIKDENNLKSNTIYPGAILTL